MRYAKILSAIATLLLVAALIAVASASASPTSVESRLLLLPTADGRLRIVYGERYDTGLRTVLAAEVNNALTAAVYQALKNKQRVGPLNVTPALSVATVCESALLWFADDPVRVSQSC